MSDDDNNVVDLRPCDTEPPCETPGYGLNKAQLPEPPDMVNSPPHYNVGGVELVDIIEHIIQDYPPIEAYHIATVIKYLGRAPYKGSKERDMKKAMWHLRRALDGRT